MTKQSKTTEPKLESLRKEDLIRMVRKLHKRQTTLLNEIAKLQAGQSAAAVEALRVLGSRTGQSADAVSLGSLVGDLARVHSAVSPVDGYGAGSDATFMHRRHVSERDLTEAAFVAALDDLAQSGVPMQQRVVPPAFPWSTSALLPAVSPVKPEDK